jgi:hypothetical protein
MGLQVKQASSYKLGILSSLILLAAVLAQPNYGVLPDDVHALTPPKTQAALTLDDTPPQVSITKPLEGQTFSYKRDANIEIRGSVTDNAPHHYYYKITGPDFNYSKTVGSLVSFEDKPIYKWNLKDRKDGVYTIRLEARDAAENKDDTQSVDEVNVTIDNSAPIINTPVTFLDGPNAENATINGVKTFHITQNEANPKRMYVELNYKDEEGKWQKHFGTEYGATNVADFTVNTGLYPEDGEYQIKISSDDEFDQHVSYAFGFVIDRTAPSLPQFSVAGGEYDQSQAVSLTTNDPGGFIYYTVDGSTPTSASPVYTGPINIGQDTVLQAMAVDRAGNQSEMSQATYMIKKTPTGGVGTPPGVPNPGSNPGSASGGDDDVIVSLLPGIKVAFNVVDNNRLTSNSTRQANSFGFFGNASVLGDSDENEAAVEGLRVSNTEEDAIFATTPTAAVVSASNEGWKLFGFAWYWWVMLAGIGASGWWVMNNLRQRTQSQEI